jgi:hypothetical protein
LILKTKSRQTHRWFGHRRDPAATAIIGDVFVRNPDLIIAAQRRAREFERLRHRAEIAVDRRFVEGPWPRFSGMTSAEAVSPSAAASAE